jgi:hypothetical protein
MGALARLYSSLEKRWSTSTTVPLPGLRKAAFLSIPTAGTIPSLPCSNPISYRMVPFTIYF